MLKVALTARIVLLNLLTFLSATYLAFASLRYRQPPNCERLCMHEPCKAGECKFGEQTAGFPLPVVEDRETGSPPSGWGKIGTEDYIYANVLAFFLNILFYNVLLLLLGKSIFIVIKRLKAQL